MPARVFSEEEKSSIRENLLEIGFPMLKEYGYIHMSIPKIASKAGIATGTFYSFFKSKEEYIYQIIVKQREVMYERDVPKEVREGKRKLTKDEVRALIFLLTDKEKSVYANLTLQDEEKLFNYLGASNIERETAISAGLFKMINTPKTQIDFPVIANLIKVLAITAEARVELHEVGYERTVETIVEVILNQIFD